MALCLLVDNGWRFFSDWGAISTHMTYNSCCLCLFQSPAGTAIRMVFNEPYMNSTSYCETRKPFVACVDFVEVRFTDNLGNTGGRFCCDDSYQRQQLYNPIVSHNNHSLILFKSWKSGARGINISISIGKYYPVSL